MLEKELLGGMLMLERELLGGMLMLEVELLRGMLMLVSHPLTMDLLHSSMTDPSPSPSLLLHLHAVLESHWETRRHLP